MTAHVPLILGSKPVSEVTLNTCEALELDFYTLWDHGLFLRDQTRVSAYARALARHVRDGSVVLEVGTGTGFFACLAARLGASHVDAIEPDSVVAAARGVLEENGLERRVSLYRGRLEDFDAKQTYDLIFSDLRGALPYYGSNLQVAAVARDWLKDQGAFIPLRDRVFVAPSSSMRILQPYLDPWTTSPQGIDLSYCRPAILQRLSIVHADKDELLAPAQLWSTVDYLQVQTPHHKARLRWRSPRNAVLTGYLAWFESELDEDIVLSNRPGAPALVYGQLFFPLADPVSLSPGDRIQLDLSAYLSANEYQWQWRTELARTSGTSVFRQSTH